MVDATDIQARMREAERKRGQTTDDLIWLGAFDPFTTSFGNTNLRVAESVQPISYNDDGERTEVTETAMTPEVALGGGLATTVLDGGAGQDNLTTTPEELLTDDANREQYEFWTQANQSGVTTLDASIFADELSEEDLLKNESFLQAAETVYDMRHGEGAWADKVADEKWSPEEAAEKLGKDGLNYISDFNFQLWEAGKTGLTIGSKTDEQQIALLYMMRAVEHKDMTWGGAGRAVMSMVTDPVNIAIGIGSLLLAIPTFGGSLAAGGAAIAAKTGVTTLAAKAGQAAFIQTLSAGVRSRVASVAGSQVVRAVTSNAVTRTVSAGMTRIASNTAVRAVTRSAVGRAFTSEVAKRAGRIAIVPGMLDSYYTDRMVFNAENNGMQALGYDPLEYSAMRGTISLAMGGGMGYGFGRAFGIGGQLIGDGFRGARNRFASSVTPHTTTPHTPHAPHTTTASANASPVTGVPNAGRRAATSGPTKATGNATGNLGHAGPFAPGRTTAFAAPGALPEYANGTNWLTHWLKVSWNPYKLFRNWTPNPRSAPTDPIPVLRPLIRAVDENLEHRGLITAMRTLQADMDDFARQLQANPGAQARILADIDTRIADFSRTHGRALTDFEADITALRNHVKDTYVTKAEYRANHGLGPDDPVPSGHYVLDGNDGRKSGLIHAVDDKGTVIFSHRDAVLEYLSDMVDLSQNLRRTDFGVEGARVRNLAAAGDTSAISREIGASLNKLRELSEGAEIRLNPLNDGRFRFGSRPNKLQEVRHLERSLAEGYYNPYSRKKIVGDTNVEHTWQQLEERWSKLLNDKGDKVDWAVPEVNRFVQDFTFMYDNGFDNEAIYTIRYLRMRRGDSGIATYPTDLVKQLKGDPRYGSDSHFRHWVDAVEQAADISKAPGHRKHPFAPGREAEKFFAEASYFYRFARRYPNHGNIATPGVITLAREGVIHPLMKTAYYFAGAAKTKVKEGDGWFRVSPVWINGDKASLWNNPARRIVTRFATGGIFSKPGLYTAGGGLALYGAGQGINYAFGDGDGTFVGDLATTVGRVPANIGLHGANFIADQTWGRIPYAPDMPYDTVIRYINHEDISETEVREALQGVIFDGTTPFHTLPQAQQNAIVQRLAADDDLSDDHINDVYRSVISNGVTTTTTTGPTTTTTRRPNIGPQQSGWDAAGNVLGDVGNAAFGWLGGDTTSSIGNMLSSTASWFGGMFNKLSSGQIRNGEKWLAGGIGLIAALVGTPMILSTLGLDKVPFLGLIVSALIFGFGGKLAHDVMTGQGTGNHRTTRTRQTQVTHTGAANPSVLAVDNPGAPQYPWESIQAADNDNDGQFAVQMRMDNGTSFVDLKVLSPSEVSSIPGGAQAIIDEAIAEGRFISNDRLAGMRLDKFENWEFTATESGTVARPDNEVAVIVHPEGDNDNYVVLELDQPA